MKLSVKDRTPNPCFLILVTYSSLRNVPQQIPQNIYLFQQEFWVGEFLKVRKGALENIRDFFSRFLFRRNFVTFTCLFRQGGKFCVPKLGNDVYTFLGEIYWDVNSIEFMSFQMCKYLILLSNIFASKKLSAELFIQRL